MKVKLGNAICKIRSDLWLHSVHECMVVWSICVVQRGTLRRTAL